jgi:hypothetical protein
MNAAHLLVQVVREARYARRAIGAGNPRAALRFVAKSYYYVGACQATRRPEYLSSRGFLHRLAVVEDIALATREMLRP